MEIDLLLNRVPLWFSYIMTVAIVFLSGVWGFRLGSCIRGRKKSENEAPLGTIVGAMPWSARVYTGVHIWDDSLPLRCSEATVA